MYVGFWTLLELLSKDHAKGPWGGPNLLLETAKNSVDLHCLKDKS